MKEIRTITMVQQVEVKYIANDGKEFTGEDAETRCETYERQQNKAKVKEAFERLDAVQINIPILDYFCSEAEVWKIKLENKRDYYSMVDYFKAVKGKYENYVEMPEEFPCIKVVMCGWEDLSEYTKNLENELKEALVKLAE